MLLARLLISGCSSESFGFLISGWSSGSFSGFECTTGTGLLTSPLLLNAVRVEEAPFRFTFESSRAAPVAELVVTGVVHADPHEGNVMLADDGRLVFLDFGLMSRVRPEIMEAFAYGIQCVLNQDWDGLVQVHHPTTASTTYYPYPSLNPPTTLDLLS